MPNAVKSHKNITAVTRVLLAAVILAVVLIVVFDKGGSASRGSGAGDIWWVDVPEVEQSYRQIKAFKIP